MTSYLGIMSLSPVLGIDIEREREGAIQRQICLTEKGEPFYSLYVTTVLSTCEKKKKATCTHQLLLFTHFGWPTTGIQNFSPTYILFIFSRNYYNFTLQRPGWPSVSVKAYLCCSLILLQVWNTIMYTFNPRADVIQFD